MMLQLHTPALNLPLFSVLPASKRALFTIFLFFTLLSVSNAKPDFFACWDTFQTHAYDNSSYIYQGDLFQGASVTENQRRFIISVDGCRKLCGKGVGYYPWAQVSSTITTWVLPIIGTLLQAPFESNAFRDNVYAIIRWVGSPFASLSYILWNIKVIGRCALLSDMSTPLKELFKPDSDASRMRDSLYILSVMNQYTVKSGIDSAEAESLLRIALFSDDLRPSSGPPTLKLRVRRKELAESLRENRKRGIVPVFVTLMWFLFSLAISIQTAFGQVGENEIAHDLALGLLLAWFPVLILSSIVDRNPVLTKNARERLCALLMDVQDALRNNDTKKALNTSLSLTPDSRRLDLSWVPPRKITNEVNDLEAQTAHSHHDKQNEIVETNPDDRETQHPQAVKDKFGKENPKPLSYEFFTGFAGQGRVRWHYGVSHPVLAAVERIILDESKSGSRKSKYHRNWLKIPHIQEKLVLGPENPPDLWHFDPREFWEIISAIFIVAGAISGAFVVSFRTPTVGLGCRAGGYVIFGCISLGAFALEGLVWYIIKAPIKLDEIRRRNRLNWGFRFLELVSTVWLVYIVLAQTIGSYQTCDCQSSLWGHWGGYIDTNQARHATNVMGYWIVGVLLSSLVMMIAIAFLVIEWCEQSHLNSEEFDKAMQGLETTRTFKKWTIFFRWLPNAVIRAAKRLWYKKRSNVIGRTDRIKQTEEKEHTEAIKKSKYRDREEIVWSTHNYDTPYK